MLIQTSTVLLLSFYSFCQADYERNEIDDSVQTDSDETIHHWFLHRQMRLKRKRTRRNKNAIEYEIHSPRKTGYGTWRGWRHCPLGQYAAGIQIKAEGDQRGRDDTGLNAVALYCRVYGSETIRGDWIMSGEGSYGEWQAVKWCPAGTAIIGFQLRSEVDQRGRDDVAADNFAAYCGSLYGERTEGMSHRIQGDTEGWGDWTANQWCPKGSVVCGINSQIEEPQGGGDDTSLNNVDLDCCQVEIPKCRPSFKIVKITDIDNTKGAGEVTHSYKKTISYRRTTGRTDTMTREERNAVQTKVSSSVKMSVGELTSGINAELGRSYEKVTSHQLMEMVQDSFTHERTEVVQVNIPAYTGTLIRQLVITCGEHELKGYKTVTVSY